MRVFAPLLGVSLALVAPAEAAPRRVASLNLCTDELLLMLAAPRQIASVTFLSQNPAETALWPRARRYRLNNGSLHDVAALRPDLILTMGGGARDRLRIASRLGIPVVDLPYPQSLDDIDEALARVAAALGRPAAGWVFRRRLATLRATARVALLDAIWLGGGGRTVAPTSLEAQWMALAGLRQRRVQGDRVSLEQLLVQPPRVLLRSNYRQGDYSASQRWLSHPIARRGRGTRVIITDGRPWTCMGPLMIGEVERLRGAVAR